MTTSEIEKIKQALELGKRFTAITEGKAQIDEALRLLNNLSPIAPNQDDGGIGASMFGSSNNF